MTLTAKSQTTLQKQPWCLQFNVNQVCLENSEQNHQDYFHDPGEKALGLHHHLVRSTRCNTQGAQSSAAPGVLGPHLALCFGHGVHLSVTEEHMHQI